MTVQERQNARDDKMLHESLRLKEHKSLLLQARSIRATYQRTRGVGFQGYLSTVVRELEDEIKHLRAWRIDR